VILFDEITEGLFAHHEVDDLVHLALRVLK
jgi:hypothetical protein